MKMVALYLRISQEDKGNPNESLSISNQRDFLINYCKSQNFIVGKIYIDDGYSGLTEERPGFQELIHDITHDKVSILITKDLSRLGRDYILIGFCLESIFPLHNVRYISVNDHIDTCTIFARNDIIAYQSIFNDLYSHENSRKVIQSLNRYKKRGLFIGSSPPYGYKRDPNDKHHLVIDFNVANIVQKIFELAMQGASIHEIAVTLTKSNFNTPAIYKQTGVPIGNPSTIPWNSTIIKRILTNQTYIGNLTQNRTRKINYKNKQRMVLEKEDWITIPNTHEKIVESCVFDKVQRNFNSQKKKSSQNSTVCLTKNNNFIFCMNCDAALQIKKDVNRPKDGNSYYYLRCSTNPCKCRMQGIQFDVITTSIQYILSLLYSLAGSAKYSFFREAKGAYDLVQAYIQKVDGKIEEGTYQCISSKLKEERNSKSRLMESSQINIWNLDSILNKSNPFICKIYVSSKQKIMIYLKFCCPF